ncbi:HPr family phosphocarrier protein [Pontiellaceae bacterium B12219]|nr:HPr family phosphocarrier protein [Pontiellaceae bacterium B12219]
MKKTKVIVPWEQGLHARPASEVIHTANRFQSTIQLKAKGRVADARSILNLLLLCATLGTLLEVEVTGNDETAAVAAIESLFKSEMELQDAEEKVS